MATPDDCSLWHSLFLLLAPPLHTLCNRPREYLELLLCIFFLKRCCYIKGPMQAWAYQPLSSFYLFINIIIFITITSSHLWKHERNQHLVSVALTSQHDIWGCLCVSMVSKWNKCKLLFLSEVGIWCLTKGASIRISQPETASDLQLFLSYLQENIL